MSLTDFLSQSHVKKQLRVLRPKFPRRFESQLFVPPRSDRHTIIGTAFDYLLRFELERRMPRAVRRPWIAWKVVEKMPFDLGDQSRDLVQRAELACQQYRTRKNPTRQDLEALADWAMRLARFDSILRALVFGDSPFAPVPQDDIEELVEMLQIAPYDQLVSEPMILNPAFGESSEIVHGADTDLLTGDALIDVKVTKHNEFKPQWLDQLFGYFLLAENHRAFDPTFPEVTRVGIYFARHGYLWTVPVGSWTDRPEFVPTRVWLFEECTVYRKAIDEMLARSHGIQPHSPRAV
jgi:hypothetical protein